MILSCDTYKNNFSGGSCSICSAHPDAVRRDGAGHRKLDQPYREQRKDSKASNCRCLHSAFLCRQSDRAEIK